MNQGGIANKLGNSYEVKCAVLHLLYVIQGKYNWLQYESIDRLQHGIDFSFCDGKVITYCQVKRNAPNGNWTARKLIVEGVFNTFFHILNNQINAKCFFFTQNDANNLKELLGKSKIANTIKQFEVSLNSNEKEEFEKICAIIDKNERIFIDLQNIEIHFLPENILEDFIESFSSLLFEGNTKLIFPVLEDILKNNYNKKLTQNSICKIINDDNLLVFRNTTINISRMTDILCNNTKNYLNSYLPFGFDSFVIFREQTEILFQEITRNILPSLTILTGVAGSGKSGIIRLVIDKLKLEDTPCFAFRIDHYLYCHNEEELGKALTNRDESLIVTIKTIFPDKPVVIIIDQIDAISDVSGRNGLFKTLIINMILKAITYENIKIILSCRTFDFENDQQLKYLQKAHKSTIIAVPSLDWAKDVEPLLQSRGINTKAYNTPQKTLLCVPVNLALFFRIENKNSIYTTRKQLFDQLITEKQREILKNRSIAWSLISPLASISHWMSEHQELNAPIVCLDDFAGAFEILSSENFIIGNNNKVHFFHESFFDYIYARSFVSGSETIAKMLLSDEQHLFRRTQVRQILEHIRADNRNRYLSELEQLLLNDNVRFHMKLAVCQWLSTIENPILNELNIILKLNDGILIYQAVLSTNNWLLLLIESGWVDKQLFEEVQYRTQIIHSLVENITLDPKAIYAIINKFVNNNEENIVMVLHNLEMIYYRKAASNEIINLISSIINNRTEIFLKNKGADVVLHIIQNSPSDLDNECIELLSLTFQKWIEINNEYIPFENDAPDLFTDSYTLEELVSKKPLIILKGSIKYFCHAVNTAILDIKHGKNHLPFYSMYEYDEYKYLHGFEKFVYIIKQSMILSVNLDKDFVISCLNLFDPYAHIIFMYLTLELIGELPQELSHILRNIITSPLIFQAGFAGAQWKIFAIAYKNSVPYIADDIQTIIENKILENYPEIDDAKFIVSKINYMGEDSFHRNSKDATQLLNNSGYEQWCVLETIGEECLSQRAKECLFILRRKFIKRKIAEPHRTEGGWIGSPISPEKCKKMTNAQWLAALKKYKSKTSFDPADSLKGGASELGGVFAELLKVDTNRFISLIAGIPNDDIKPYLHSILFGLSQTENLSIQDTILLLKRVHGYPEKEHGNEVCDIIGKNPGIANDMEVLDMLKYYALNGHEEENPEDEEQRIWQKISTINSLLLHENNKHLFLFGERYHAFRAIAAILWEDYSHIKYLWNIINFALDTERLISVRCMIIESLIPVFNNDKELFKNTYEKLSVFPANSPYCEHSFKFAPFITDRAIELYFYISQHMPELADAVIQKLWMSQNETVKQFAVYFISYEYFRHDKHIDLFNFTFNVNTNYNKIIAYMAGMTLKITEKYSENIRILKLSFCNKDESVRKESSRFLEQIKPDELDNYLELVLDYLNSPAFNDYNFHLFRILEETPSDIMDIIITIGKRIIDQIKQNSRGYLETLHHFEDYLEIYYSNTVSNPDQRKTILDIIDSLLQSGTHSAFNLVNMHDR
ncbi:hypothetical protein AGMMS50293_01160 [Spirochaetia bacterium]|nr:hypothetical protein AGMMS50293_01160 [Spirochaetia bacterium]